MKRFSWADNGQLLTIQLGAVLITYAYRNTTANFKLIVEYWTSKRSPVVLLKV